MKTLEEQQITKKEEVTDSNNRDYADELLEKYEEKIRHVVYGMFKKITTYVPLQDREDIVIDVCLAFWELVYSGKFKGEYGEASIKACISAIAKNKKHDFLVKFIREKRLRAREPDPRWFKPNGEKPVASDPMIERLPPYFGREVTVGDIIDEYGKREGVEFIQRETKYPEIIDSYRKGYSIQVIARTYGLTDEQVKKRIYREKKRLAKIAKQQGWYYGDLKKLK